MSYENEKEVVLTKETFVNWAKRVNGNKAAMKCGAWSGEKPLYHLEKATNTKTPLDKYEFVFHPMKLNATVDEVIAAKDEVIAVPEPNRTATATYYAKDGHKIVEHCQIG